MFRSVRVARTEPLSPHLLRVTLQGTELADLEPGLPAASVRLLVPSAGTDELVVPTWAGNEFLLPDGSRPVIRTYTPRRVDPIAFELDVDVVLHEKGIVAAWAQASTPGVPAAVAGTGRGYAIDPDATAFVLGGDEAALPAISVLLEALPSTVPVTVIVEVGRPDARLELPAHPSATVEWVDRPAGTAHGDALGEAITRAALRRGAHIWVAGEAAAVQRIRRHLFEDRALPRSQCTVRGYWKHGRRGDADDG